MTRVESTELMRNRAADGPESAPSPPLMKDRPVLTFREFTRVVLLKVISATPPRLINGNTETSASL